MRMDRVTITGADDSVDPEDVLALGQEFPFVEWGILVSATRGGSVGGWPRFPSYAWIDRFRNIAPRDTRLSLHVCGRWVRQLLLGHDELPIGLLDRFQRVQLNFHAERTRCDAIGLYLALSKMGRQFIFQVDGASGNVHLETLYGKNVGRDPVDAVPLFDVSGGAGIVPCEWPKPMYLATPDDPLYHGYAGGLGPDTLPCELPRIAEAAGNARIWIDMETRVRSEADRQQFDLAKVRAALALCAPAVNAGGGPP